MVHNQQSNLDALNDPQVPASSSQVQYSSRREAREAAARAAQDSPVVLSVPAVPSSSEVHTSPAVLSVPAVPVAQSAAPSVPFAPSQAGRLPVESDSPVAASARQRSSGRKRSAPRGSKRSVLASQRASAPQKERKNPLSVLATMAVVGGLFAVAGLPAYATVSQDLAAKSAITEADAQSVSVSDDAVAASAVRDGFKATTPEQLASMEADALRAAQNAAYNASGARAMGDDYPWPYELMDDQGGGLSPLNYYYRECVDFVAWRLNRDAGSYSAPFKYVWSNLTPYGGNGGQWMYNWQALGRTVSSTPVVGAVAYTGGNHVAYVKSVNGDGTVTIEEYNYIPGQYGQRTIPASSVVAFLYPPG